MNKTVGILGCGWLGTPLGTVLVNDGYSIKGSTTSKDKLGYLSENNISPFLVQLGKTSIKGNIGAFLNQVDVLVINVPPNLRKSPKGNYVRKMEALLQAVKTSKVPKVLFISSTSVYGNREGEITEGAIPNPISNSGKQLLKSEKLFVDHASFSTTILRFGGLIGEDRHPVYQLAGKELYNGGELINLIHRKDGIHMIRTIIGNDYWNEVFNGVYPYHPTKSAYYTAEAKKKGVPIPIYLPSSKNTLKKKILARNFYAKNHSLATSISP